MRDVLRSFAVAAVVLLGLLLVVAVIVLLDPMRRTIWLAILNQLRGDWGVSIVVPRWLGVVLPLLETV